MFWELCRLSLNCVNRPKPKCLLTPLVEEDVDRARPDQQDHDDDEDLVRPHPVEPHPRRRVDRHTIGVHDCSRDNVISERNNLLSPGCTVIICLVSKLD